MMKRKNLNWAAGLLAAAAASLCCITPLLALLGGAGSFATAFAGLQPYRPWLAGLTLVIFGFAWYRQLKPRTQAGCECESQEKESFLQSKSFLGIVTVIAALLFAFPYYGKILYPRQAAATAILPDKGRLVTTTLRIGGMDCEACTAHINSELSRQEGVFDANTSYGKANVVIRFDSSKTSANHLEEVIRSIGYTVISSGTKSK